MNNQKDSVGFLTDQDLGDQQAETIPDQTIGQILSSDPFQTAAFEVDRWAQQVQFGLNRLFLDRIQGLDRKVMDLSQCIEKEVMENQELALRIQELESDRQLLLKALVKVANRGVWYAQLIFSELSSPLRTELTPLVHPFVRPYAQSVVDALEHIPMNKPTPDTTESNADRPKMKIRSIDQLLKAWQETGSVSTL